MLMPTGSISCFIAILPLLTSAAPALNARQDGPGHSYECEAKYNAAAKKQQLRNDGATARGPLSPSIHEFVESREGTND